MPVPSIALYLGSPSASVGVCSLDFEPHAAAAAAVAAAPRQVVAGLSGLFSSPAARSAPTPSFAAAACSEDLASLRRERSDELGSGGCSHSYSAHAAAASPLKCRSPSPVSVFHGPSSPWLAGDWRAGRDRLFRSFVRNALSSCLDYAPASPRPGGGVPDAGELVFELEDADPAGEPWVQALLGELQSRHKIFHDDLVVKAFFEADKAHRDQARANGDPYLRHCAETAALLAGLGANATVVAAGLLHDAIDDAFMDYHHISHAFSSGVADLVKAVSKLSHLSELARENDTASRPAEADRLHTMYLAMTDARAVLIKLADRLHNMRTLDALSPAKQRRLAKETLEIFVPLAGRLGISTWKDQLETLCFRHLNPDEYQSLSAELANLFDEALITAASEQLSTGLRDAGIAFDCLTGRNKGLYSISAKMKKKNLPMSEIHDIHGLRLVVENEEDCYRALDVVHRIWRSVDGQFKDYIKNPKSNGYQSLHTVVVSGDDAGLHPFEVQIRTRNMHLHAEYGFAAHWRYKEANQGFVPPAFVGQIVEYARWAFSWQCESMGSSGSVRPSCPFPQHADDCPYSYTRQCNHDGPVFVVLLENGKMSVEEFPAGSTVADLMERVGVGAGGRRRWGSSSYRVSMEGVRPRVNRELVNDPARRLSMGDEVELSPGLPRKSLVECREEIQRMYEAGLAASSSGHGGWWS